ncbi:MAG: NADH-quinone oxidoreductase subunit F, partial [Planctomycetaceae bacterium]
MELVLTQNISPTRQPLDRLAYEQAGGYQALRKALKQMTPEQVRAEVSASGLRGRGGAGFPTGKKWQFAISSETPRRPRYFCINADEMEPGTFKDRVLMEGDPHQLVESAICASYALDVDICYIFLRREYVLSASRLTRAIAHAYDAGYLGKNIIGSGYSLEMHLHTSAGRYMCGEENGLINALEGRR